MTVAAVAAIVAAVAVAYVMADKTVFGPIMCILSLFRSKLYILITRFYRKIGGFAHLPMRDYF